MSIICWYIRIHFRIRLFHCKYQRHLQLNITIITIPLWRSSRKFYHYFQGRVIFHEGYDCGSTQFKHNPVIFSWIRHVSVILQYRVLVPVISHRMPNWLMWDSERDHPKLTPMILNILILNGCFIWTLWEQRFKGTVFVVDEA